MKQHHIKKIRKLSWFLFCCYLGVMIYLLFFSEYLNRESGGDYRYNLVLFREVKRSFWCLKAGNTSYFILNFVMNIIAFIPYGFFLPVLSKNKHSKNIFYIIFSVLEFTITIEVIQLVLKVGTFDVDDIFLNTIGGLVGYLLFIVVYMVHIFIRRVLGSCLK